MKGEIDLVAFMRSIAREIAAAALPVVVQKHAPVEFWEWTPRTKLCSRGLWNIPSPVERVLVEPEVLLVPLIGFDEAGFRLGYGGGYYDRTLAALAHPALAIGIGHELGRLGTIHPQPHDVPMNLIVTEHGVAQGDARRT
jgi:5-formyltetrahydrofolate cyclo-ligase